MTMADSLPAANPSDLGHLGRAPQAIVLWEPGLQKTPKAYSTLERTARSIDTIPSVELELARIKVFDVLRNALNGEMTVVMQVSGDRLDLRDRGGAVARYKFGRHFTLVSGDDAVAFRAELQALRKRQQEERKGKKRRTVQAFLNRLAKKR